MNPFVTFPILLKSFFPPKDEGGEEDVKVGKGEKKKKNIKKRTESEGSPLTELIMKIFKKEGAAEEGEKPKGTTIRREGKVSSRFDMETGKAYINNQEVEVDEYVKFKQLSKQEQLDQYGKTTKLQTVDQKGNVTNLISSLETYTEYEGPTGGAPIIIRPSTTTANQPMNGGGTKEVAMVPVPVGMGADPYEDLDFFG
tara:strand:- start:18 stop:611 length:594 start_codon:yes stop_codon:yes gene_type:complete